MQRVTVATIKGGSGKTSTALAIAQAGAASGIRVLGIDLDPQSNFTYATGADLSQPGAVEMLHGAPASDVIQETAQGVDVIGANAELATEGTAEGSIYRLDRFLKGIEDYYDLCVVDTPPHIGETTYNALAAATDLIIPMCTAAFEIAGLYNLVKLHAALKKSKATHIHRRGIVLTKYDARAKLNQYIRQEIEETAAEHGIPILGTIRSGIAIAEAQTMRANLYEYAPRSKPAEDYKAIFERIIAGNGKNSY